MLHVPASVPTVTSTGHISTAARGASSVCSTRAAASSFPSGVSARLNASTKADEGDNDEQQHEQLRYKTPLSWSCSPMASHRNGASPFPWPTNHKRGTYCFFILPFSGFKARSVVLPTQRHFCLVVDGAMVVPLVLRDAGQCAIWSSL
jgi:hypothetical protein